MTLVMLVLVYGATIVASSLAGSYLPTMIRMTHTRMQVILSFVGGLMLGVALLHLLPHSFALVSQSIATGSAPPNDIGLYMRSMQGVSVSVLVGLLVTFFMMRLFQFHQHGEKSEHEPAHSHDQHDHDPTGAAPCDASHGISRHGWIGVVLGLSLHTFLDGIALGAAVTAARSAGYLAGFGVYLSILLHKPLDAMSVATLMHQKSCSMKMILWSNGLLALMCPLGALCVMYGFSNGGSVLGYLLGASAGVFLCISLSDLLPEVQFHHHDRLTLSAALLIGIAVAYAVEWLHGH